MERDEFKTLALPHLDRLLAVAGRWGSHTDAEDFVQETYLRAFRAFAELRERGAVFAWLCQILRNVVSSQYRGRSRRRDLAEVVRLEEAHEQLLASDGVSPLEGLLARLDAADLREALRSIPPEFAEAIELHDVQGLKYREIALATTVPIGTVMSRISRGRRLLAGLLASRE